MLGARLISPDGTLNSFESLSALPFVPGETLTIRLQLTQPLKGSLRYMPAAGATLEARFIVNDTPEELDLALSEAFDPDDRSIWEVTLTPAQTEILVGSNIELTLTEGAVISKAKIGNILQRTNLSGDC